MNNERDFIKQLMDCYEKIVKMLTKYTKDLRAAEELVLDAITIIWEKYIRTNKLKTENLCGLLFVVAKREWMNRQGRLSNTVALDEKLLQEEIEIIGDVEEVEDSEDAKRRQAMRLTLSKLGEKCEKLLRRYLVDEIKLKHLVKELGYTSYDSIKSSKYQCVKQLERYFFSFL